MLSPGTFDVYAGFLVLWSAAAVSWSYRSQGSPIKVKDMMATCLLLMIGWQWTGLSYVFLMIAFIATTAQEYVMRLLPGSWLRQGTTVLGRAILNGMNVASRWTLILGVGLAKVYEMRTRGLFAR